MFTLYSRVWVRSGVEVLRGPGFVIKYKPNTLCNKYNTIYSVHNICIMIGLIPLLCCSWKKHSNRNLVLSRSPHHYGPKHGWKK